MYVWEDRAGGIYLVSVKECRVVGRGLVSLMKDWEGKMFREFKEGRKVEEGRS